LVTLNAASRINSDSGTLTLDPTSGNAITGTQNLTLGGVGNITVNDPIATSTGTLTKDGSGTATLAAANTFSGAITISAGILAAANNSSLGTTAGGVSVTAGAVLSLSGGITVGDESLTLNGTGISSGGGLRSTSGDNTYNGAVSLSSASSVGVDANSLSLGGTVSGGNSLTKVGAGTLILTGTNSYSGGTTVSAGTLQGNTTSLQGNIVNNAAVIMTQTFDGTYAGAMSGSGTLTKQGSGVATLTGASSHSGATTVSAGTLVQNGTNASSAVTVASGATVRGGGKVDGLTVSGTVWPGNNASIINRLNVASLTMNNGSAARFRIGDASVSTDRDFILNDGSATINATTTIYIDDTLISNWDNTQSGAWNLIVGGISDASNFTLDDSTYWSSALGGGSFSLAASSGNLVLVFTAAGGAPTVTTDAITEIAITTAKGGGNVTADGGDTVTERGVVWNTGGLPTTADNKHAADAGGVGVFTNILTGLTPGQLYYVRAYAINANGTGYGLEESFTAGCFTSAPISQAASSIGYTNFTANWSALTGASGYRLDVSASASFGGDTIAGVQDFEASPASPTATYSASGGGTVSGNSASGDRPASSPFHVSGSQAYSIANGTATVTFDAIDTSGYSDVELSMRLASFSISSTGNGADVGDIVTVSVSPDNGSTYYSTVRVLGNSNAQWSYADGTGVAATDYDGDTSPVDFQPGGGGNRTSDGYSTIIVSNIPKVAQMRVRVAMLNNSANERWTLDDVTLTGRGGDYIPGYSNRTVAGTSEVVTGLTDNATYYYRVRAVGAGACVSADSATQTVTTLEYQPPGIGVVTNLAASSTVGSNPSAGAFIVTNIGQRLLSYMVTSNVSWLSISPVSGTNIAEGGSQSHTVNYNVSGMSAGVYTGIVTITGTGSGVFAATNSPREIKVVLTLNAIPNPTAVTATADGREMIRLAWTKNVSHDVLILYRSSNTPSGPVAAQAYNVDDTLGGNGTRVIYKGALANLEHIILPGGTNHYAFYSINNNHYSSGINTNVITTAYPLVEIVEPFAYTNSGTLATSGHGNGGHGWTNGWTGDVSSFNMVSGSFASASSYPTNTANRVRINSADIDGTSKTGFRNFDAYTSGKVYVGFILNYQFNGANKYAGLSFMDGTTEEMFFGEGFGGDERLAVGSTISGSNLLAGAANVYVVIGMYDFAADTGYVAAYKIGTDTVPATEPGTWHATVSDGSISRIDGIRIAAGAGGGSGTPGDTYFDEIRVATSWESLIANYAEPEIAVLGTDLSVITTANTPAVGNGTDFGSTLVAGGTVDRTFYITNSDAGRLDISAVTTSGAHQAEFVILSYPEKVSPGMVSNLVIRFDPAGAGARTATVVVANNDSDESLYSFYIKGTGQVPPTVLTTVATATNATTADAGGDVTDDGYAAVTNRGVVWSLSANPTVPGAQTTNGIGTGTFSSTLTNLVEGGTYFYRAFAQNTAGTSYGDEYSLTTPCFEGVVTGHYVSVTNDVTFGLVWSNVPSSNGYQLDVSSNSSFVVSTPATLLDEGFAGGTTPPSGWSFTAIGGTYASAGNFGRASPALQMDNTNDRVETPSFSNPTGVTIWIKGQSTDASSSLLVESFDGSWSTVTTIMPLPTSGTDTNMPLGASVTKLRFTYTKSVGNLAFDDVIVTGISNTPYYIAGYSNRTISGTSHTVTGLVSGATYYYRLRATNEFCVTADSTTGSVTTIILAATIDVFGNNVLIADGSATPSPADHTDFGTVGLVNSNLVRTYSITNDGPGALTILNVTTSGAAASDFIVVSAPGTIAAGEAANLLVRFDPTAAGTRTATIVISNNVAGKNPYDFVVQGTGVTAGIYLSPVSISVTSIVGSAPSAAGFGVTNVGLGDLIYTVSTNAGWLTVAPVNGTNTETEGRQHTVTFGANGLVAGVSNATITVTSAGVTNSPQTVDVTWTLNAIPDVLLATATNDGNEMVRLHWTKHASHDVLITSRSTNAPTAPVQGTSYSVGGSIGSDGTRVIYIGTGADLEHIVLPGSINHYAFYSINNNHYSPGTSIDTTMGSYDAGEIVQVFAYTNGVTLAGTRGGLGWGTNIWLGATQTFVVVSDSFATQTNYPVPRANKVRTTPASDTTNIVRRQLTNTFGSGKIYVGYIMNFQYDGPDKFAGLMLMSNGVEKLFVGEVGSADVRFGIDGTASGLTLTNGTGHDYILIMRYDWATGEAVGKAYKIGNDTVPVIEPSSWDVTVSKASNVVGRINQIGLQAGAGSGTPGDVYFDEIRIGRTWEELVRVPRSKVIYDGFGSSSGSISGQGGGTGWSDTWTLGGDPFVNYDSGSFPLEKSSYYQPSGNKIVMYGDVDGRWITATRTFETTFTNGQVYFSWMQNYAFNGTDKYAGLTLLDGGTEKAFVGKVSSANKALGVDSSTDNRSSGVDLENGAGNDYVIVAKYDFATRELSATSYKTTEESIAEEPNGYWQVTTTQSVSHISTLTGARFSIGAGVGVQVGFVYMDEIRVGTNWFEVTRKDGEQQAPAMAVGPTPRLLYIGTNYNPALNPQGSAGNITITDYDLANTSEPLDIAVLWSNSFGVFMTNLNPAVLNIGSRDGRVNPNWDPVVQAGSDFVSIGYDAFFTNFVGYNGALTVTSYVHAAFNITNSTFDDTYFITMSAENNNLGGGTFAPYNSGDNIPYWRALTVNTALQFFVQDDDADSPEVFEFTIDGEGGFGDTNLTAGAIAIIAVNGAPSSMDERFSFVVLRPFPSGTILKFTDGGWDPNGDTWHRLSEFHTNEWVSPGNASVGQVIELSLQDINNSGDQIVVYQYTGVLAATNDPDNVRFINAVNLDVDNDGWDVNPIPNDNEHSGIYRGLTNGETAVSVPLRGFHANAYYTGTVVGTASDLLLSISDSNNWYVVPMSSATNLVITNYSFTVTGSGTIDWTLASLSDENVLTGGYVITNIARDDYSGLVATNTTFASAPYFVLYNTNDGAAVSNYFAVDFPNGTVGFRTITMTAPPGSYPDITIGTVSSLVYVADMDSDRNNDHLDVAFSMPVFIYDDDPDPPLIGTNLVTMMLGNIALQTATRSQLLAGWNFNDTNTDVDHGSGSFNSNLSSAISFANGGTTLNAVSGDGAGNDITISGTANIGRYVQFDVDMTGHQNLVLTLAAQRSAAGYDSNSVSYSINGDAPVVFQSGWTPALSYALATFDFSAVTAMNNATSVSIYITFGTNSATGGGNNRFDNIQLNAQINRYYEITDAELALIDGSNPLKFSFNIYDEYSGLSRGTANTGTNMLVNIAGIATNNTANYASGMSSASSLTSGSTSMWSFADAIDYNRRGALYADGQSNRPVLATFADLDNDRLFDTQWASNRYLASFRVIDDDTNTPVAANIRYTGFSDATKPFLIATSSVVLADTLIRNNLARRTGSGSNTVWGLSDEDLANAGNLEFVFGARDVHSGVSRGTSGSTNEVMSFSIGAHISGNFANYDAGLSSAQGSTNITTTNVWSFTDGFFSDNLINALITGGQHTVRVTIPDLDDDRPNDRMNLVNTQVGFLRVIDDDIRGPLIATAETPEMEGGRTILYTSFEVAEGWPSTQGSGNVWTNEITSGLGTGTWYGTGFKNFGDAFEGTHKGGFTVNGVDQYFELPPRENVGRLSLMARLSSGETNRQITVERREGAAWVNYGTNEVLSSDYQWLTWDVSYPGVSTLRVVRVGINGTPGINIDSLTLTEEAVWVSTSLVNFAWTAAVDDYSGIDEYRLVAPVIGSSVPTLTNHGSGISAAITTNIVDITGNQGVLTGFVFAVDNDNDRANDRSMGNIASIVVRIDTNPPMMVTEARATDAQDGFLFDLEIDESSEIKVEWAPFASEAQAAGWRQSDSVPLSPWDTYVITYYEVDDTNGVPITDAITTVLTRATANWTNVLNSHAFTNLLITDLNFDAYYAISIQGLDEAGNLGIATNVIGSTDKFIVTQGVNRVDLDLELFWTGPEDVNRDYDVLYVDSSSGFYNGLSNQWQMMQYTNRPVMHDTGSVWRVRPGELTNHTYRFYRVAKSGMWSTNRSNRSGSVEIYVTKSLTLYPGENWHSLFFVPDTATVAYVFNTNLLPMADNFADSTKITWFGSSLGGTTNQQGIATAVVWLADSGNWTWHIGGAGLANDMIMPLNQGFLIELPTNALPQTLVLVGRVPTNQIVQTITGGTSVSNAYHILSHHLPVRSTLANMGFMGSGFTRSGAQADEIRVLDQGGDGSLKSPKVRIRLNAAQSGWEYAGSYPGYPPASQYIIEPDDAVIIVRKNPGTMYWTNRVTFTPPTKNFSP